MRDFMKRCLERTGIPSAFFSYQIRKHQRILGFDKGVYILSFDIDYERDVKSIPEILDILSKHRICASFACVGKWVEQYPKIHRSILSRGHEILNHTYSHPDNAELNPRQFFISLSAQEKRNEIGKFHAVCRKLLGYTPIGFRTPHFGRQHTPDVYGILRALGYQYSSSVSAADAPHYGIPYQREGVWELPLSCSPRHPRCVFDSWASRTSPKPNFKTDDDFLREFKSSLVLTERYRAFTTHYFDPWHVVQNDLLPRMCKELVEKNIDLMTYQQFVQTRIPTEQK